MPKLPFLCLAAFFLSSLSPISAQQAAASVPAPTLPNPDTLLPVSGSDYLASLLILRPLRAAYGTSPQWRNYYFEMLGMNESFVGNDAEAIADFDAARLPEPQEPTADSKAALSGYVSVDARQAVLTLAARRRAVFIREADYAPLDRAFTLSLLRGLYRQGYRYFAAEALYDNDFGLGKRGYPLRESGYSVREPVFGDLVRTALKLGFEVVPYDYSGPLYADPIAAQNQRERGEAQNLYDFIFKHDPKAKVLVEFGFGSVAVNQAAKRNAAVDFLPSEAAPTSKSSATTPMALWFRKFTGIQPLQIDQSVMMEHSALEYENPLYKAAIADNLLQDKPVVLKDKSGHFFVRPTGRETYDLSVFHPRTQYEFGRPTWLSLNGLRQAYVLPGDLGIPANTSALVQAFYESEPAASAIPIDQVEIKPGLNPLPSLMLPKGRFYMRVVNGTGMVLREWHITRNGATP